MIIEAEIEGCQRDLILQLARIIYRTHGAELPADPWYLYGSQHPTEQGVLAAAEQIFELLTGDSPSYDDDDDDDESDQW